MHFFPILLGRSPVTKTAQVAFSNALCNFSVQIFSLCREMLLGSDHRARSGSLRVVVIYALSLKVYVFYWIVPRGRVF
jgi:hypothetical protein